MTTVAIIQKEVPHYRSRFFEEVSTQASALGFSPIVYCGTTARRSTLTFPHRSLPLVHLIPNHGGPFWLKGLTTAVSGVDVIVAPQGLQCLNVPYLWAHRRQICTRWIWWGHGYNFQASLRRSPISGATEAVKRFMTRRADGLITYTAGGAAYWQHQGMPADRVVHYDNTIDVDRMRRIRADVSLTELDDLRRKHALDGKRTLLFSGRLYAAKKVDYILRTFSILKKSCPAVALLIIGDGEERRRLQRLAADLATPDVHFLGELLRDEETAPYFSLADLLVMPALVGLAIVHGYAFGVPMVTTDLPGHGPEIEYLTGDAGIVTTPDETQTAMTIASILGAPERLLAMKRAAMAQGDRLRLAQSARRFVLGMRALAECAS